MDTLASHDRFVLLLMRAAADVLVAGIAADVATSQVVSGAQCFVRAVAPNQDVPAVAGNLASVFGPGPVVPGVRCFVWAVAPNQDAPVVAGSAASVFAPGPVVPGVRCFVRAVAPNPDAPAVVGSAASVVAPTLVVAGVRCFVRAVAPIQAEPAVGSAASDVATTPVVPEVLSRPVPVHAVTMLVGAVLPAVATRQARCGYFAAVHKPALRLDRRVALAAAADSIACHSKAIDRVRVVAVA